MLDPSQQVHKRPLPKQRKLPEIRIKRPSPMLEYDQFRAEAERARKRRRIAEEEQDDDNEISNMVIVVSPEA